MHDIHRSHDSPYHSLDALGMRGEGVIRVLIADEIARIVGDLEKLAPYTDVVDVCGVAHQVSAVIEEAWLRQPDVLVLHEGFAELPPADFAAHLESVSPATRVLLMTAGDTPAADELDRGSRDRGSRRCGAPPGDPASPPVSSQRALHGPMRRNLAARPRPGSRGGAAFERRAAGRQWWSRSPERAEPAPRWWPPTSP